jgi:hypothetical protein
MELYGLFNFEINGFCLEYILSEKSESQRNSVTVGLPSTVNVVSVLDQQRDWGLTKDACL